MFVTEKPVDGTLSLVAPDGSAAAVVTSPERRGSGPYSWFAEVATPAAGTWHATLDGIRLCAGQPRNRGQRAEAGADIGAAGTHLADPRQLERTTEALFAAWIEKLFDAPPEQDLSWKVWSEVLRDQSRNFLFNYLGRGEDNVSTGLRPDCADFVYFLRAYFAYKMGLPFGYSNCSRGMGGSPPKCYQWFDIDHPEVTRPPPPPEQVDAAAAAPTPTAAPAAPTPKLLGIFGRSAPPADDAAAAPPAGDAPLVPPKPKPKRPATFAEYLRDVGDVVHTGAVRVRGADDNTDFYTIPLTEKTLRPGTVYADPYGHVLMLVHLVPEQNGTPGRLPCRRRRARRLDHAQAILARQFPVRA